MTYWKMGEWVLAAGLLAGCKTRRVQSKDELRALDGNLIYVVSWLEC